MKKMESTGWAMWWLWLWAAMTFLLLGLILFIAFKIWAGATVVGFGAMEGLGMARSDDAYPPLTHVICRYVPRWIAFTLIYAFTGAAGGHWFGFGRPWHLGLLIGLLGWFTTHFDVAFDERKRQEERVKYERIWGRLRGGLNETR